jgi:hypothetical protein
LLLSAGTTSGEFGEDLERSHCSRKRGIVLRRVPLKNLERFIRATAIFPDSLKQTQEVLLSEILSPTSIFGETLSSAK